ncbi:unnamed protein product [Prunus armeniaca]|uniref:Neprosin activation peptide domain-containing protein n=1 Tax=Prunus armeniaca TaxID=36596 RepID=A0A6J5WTD1_PRUAR|nr:unnamed protein product [Prunus armeniaca]
MALIILLVVALAVVQACAEEVPSSLVPESHIPSELGSSLPHGADFAEIPELLVQAARRHPKKTPGKPKPPQTPRIPKPRSPIRYGPNNSITGET